MRSSANNAGDAPAVQWLQGLGDAGLDEAAFCACTCCLRESSIWARWSALKMG
jgi:hypothetical protein